MKKDVHLNFHKTFQTALTLLLAVAFAYLAIYQGLQGEWIKFLLCVIAPAPLLIFMLIIRKQEFTRSWTWIGLKRQEYPTLELDLRFNYAGMWFGLFQWIFLALHRRNKLTHITKVAPGKEHSYSGVYSESTKRTAYTDWREGSTYYTIKGRRVYIRAVLPDRY